MPLVLYFSSFIAFCICLAQAQNRPNVIYILADDLGYGDLSCYGQTKLSTPHIDRIASEGIKFTNHYSGNTVCSPSRAVLMTGIDSGNNYLRGNREEIEAAIPPSLTTIAELFKSQGYTTGAFGKWGLGATNGTLLELPSTQGFDQFCGWKNQQVAHTYYPSSYVRNGEEIPLDEKTYVHDLIMNDAYQFIEENAKAGQPFFCYIPTAIPHAAMHAPKELHDKWRKKLPQFENRIGKYRAGTTEKCPDVINPVAGFAAMIEHLDNNVGQIIDLLEKYQIEKNTLVIFSSDNGPSPEGGHDLDFWNSRGGLRGMKRDMHEAGVKTPMIARWPEHIKPGSVSDHLSGFHDVLPTFSELLGTQVPKHVNGLSFLPTLLGQKNQAQHEYLYIEFNKRLYKENRYIAAYSRIVRFGNWKAYRSEQSAQIELYNLEHDPQEQYDLGTSAQFAPVVTKALLYMDQASTPIEDLPYLKNE